MISARLLVAPVLAGLLAATLTSAPVAAHAVAKGKKYTSEFAAAPNFPASTLAVKVKGKPRAGDRAKVVVSGFNTGGPISPGSSVTYDFDVYLFVADRSVVKSCPYGYGEMLNTLINNSDVVADLGQVYIGSGGSFAKTFMYKTGSTRKVLYCSYVRWVTDDVSVSALKHDFPKAKKK